MKQNWLLWLITSSSFLGTILFFQNNFHPFSQSTEIIQDDPYCGTDALRSNLDFHLQKAEEDFEKAYQTFLMDQNGDQAESLSPPPYTLPIVFHIIHNNGNENISDADVLQGLADLNEAFANLGYYDPTTGEDMQVQFCLAKQDPDGAATSGINRVNSALTNMTMETEDLSVKNLIRWDPTAYINVWIVREICSNSSGCGVAGYAYFPSAHGSDIDGIVLEANYMGNSPANSGVLIHEMGHYLGLYHTFQGGCPNGDCLAAGDRVCDTPPDQSTAPVPCGNTVNSCSTDVNATDPNNPFTSDQNDMYINYMDYGDLDCYSAFTAGQRTRMHFSIENTRESLLTSVACNDPCLNPITANFTASGTLVNVGTVVNFNNNSTGATNYEWLLDGVPFSSTTNSSYTFNTEGIFTITLHATNTDPNCFEIFKIEIEVTCPVSASFIVSSSVVSPGDAVLFNNTSTNSNTYEWWLDGAVVSTGFNFTYTFATNGNYDVQLIASDGVCSDTSALTVISVSASGLAQTGLPVWAVTSNGSGIIQGLDWRDSPPLLNTITNDGEDPPSQTGVAIDACGGLAFYAIQTGSSDPDHLFLYAPDGTPILSDVTANEPGLNAVRGGHEIQVVRVPLVSNEWYIIYSQWSTDSGSPISNAGYNPARLLYARVRLNDTYDLEVLERDVVLNADGSARTYTDGRAVSRTANGNINEHFLYACRRANAQSFISLDRWVISEDGIVWQENTGQVNVPWWSLTMAGSPMELSPTEEKIAVTCRNQNTNRPDIVVFNANDFDNTNVDVIIGGELILVADGTANDLSNELPNSGKVKDIANNTALNLRFLRNFERKLSSIEFSPNGRFLYVLNGGYNSGSATNLTYLAQIDLEADPLEVRMQIQTTPNDSYSATTGVGCSSSNATCNADWSATSRIESSYDGNLYFTKRNDNIFYVIPDPNNVLPQNLVPSDIDLSTPDEPNILTNGNVTYMPDQIDGFNYLATQFQEVEMMVNALDCDNNCLAPYLLEVMLDGQVVETLEVEACPDNLLFCADTNLVYSLYAPSIDLNYDSAIVFGEVQYPDTTLFDFSDLEGCVEICDNNIDDDNDGLVDCDDPDLQNECCCLNPPTLDLGPDLSVCDNGVTFLDAGAGFQSYKWSDLSTEPTFTASGAGTYWVEVRDLCENIQSDSVVIALQPPTVLDIGNDTTICAGETVTLSTNGFDGFQWTPSDFLNCDDCPTVTASPTTSISYILVANTDMGCYSVDTITITIADTFFTQIDTTICDNSAFTFNGQDIPTGTSMTFDLVTQNGCDSTVLVNVFGNNLNSSEQTVDTFACENSSIVFDGTAIFSGTSDTLVYTNVAGCDSTIFIHVAAQPIFETAADTTICFGESMVIFGNTETVSGDYSMTFPAQNGCDSTHTFSLEVLEELIVSFEITPSCIDESTGSIISEVTGGQPPYTFNWDNTTQNIPNQNDLSAGNYNVTITDDAGCEMIANPSIATPLNINLVATTEDILCYGESNGVIDLSANPVGLTYSLNGGAYSANTTFAFLPAGNYFIDAQDNFGCEYSLEVPIYQPPALEIALPKDTVICLGESIDIFPQINSNHLESIVWSTAPGLACYDCLENTATPFETTTYSLSVIDSSGCEVSDDMTIFVEKIRRVYIPNAFSPNGDGANDFFRLYAGKGVVEIKTMKIFDRWGELVYEANHFLLNDPSKAWDGFLKGKVMDPAIFVYLIEVSFLDGFTEIYKGDISLMR